MEILALGKVMVAARIENLNDLTKAEEGVLSQDQVRAIEVTDALIDTGAAMLSLPKRLVAQLGLRRIRTRTAKTTAGIVSFDIYGPVRLTVQGRDCTIEAAEVPDDCPALIGQIPLELLDFVVDPVVPRLASHPETWERVLYPQQLLSPLLVPVWCRVA